MGEFSNLLAELSLVTLRLPAAKTRSHMAKDAQFGDTITIPLNPPYNKELPIALNEFGIPVKDRYRNEDLAKVLSVHPTTIQWRCDHSKYGEIKKDAAGRRYFTLDEVRWIVFEVEKFGSR